MIISPEAMLQDGARDSLKESEVLLREEENRDWQVVRAFVDEQVAPSAPRYWNGIFIPSESIRFTDHPDSHRVDQVESIEKVGRIL